MLLTLNTRPSNEIVNEQTIMFPAEDILGVLKEDAIISADIKVIQYVDFDK